MHETKFAAEVVYVLEKRVDKTLAANPITVKARLSPFSHVTPEALREAFAQLVQEADFKNACLEVRPMELEFLCKACGRISKSAERLLSCPRCGSPEINAQALKEFIIESVEIEG